MKNKAGIEHRRTGRHDGHTVPFRTGGYPAETQGYETLRRERKCTEIEDMRNKENKKGPPDMNGSAYRLKKDASTDRLATVSTPDRG